MGKAFGRTEMGYHSICGSTSFSTWIHCGVLLKKVTSEHRKSNHVNPC